MSHKTHNKVSPLQSLNFKLVYNSCYAGIYCNHTEDLANIQLPPKVRKRGRPKGAALTVIGLPKKKDRMYKPQELKRKPHREKEKGRACTQMLQTHVQLVRCYGNDCNL